MNNSIQKTGISPSFREPNHGYFVHLMESLLP